MEDWNGEELCKPVASDDEPLGLRGITGVVMVLALGVLLVFVDWVLGPAVIRKEE